MSRRKVSAKCAACILFFSALLLSGQSGPRSARLPEDEVESIAINATTLQELQEPPNPVTPTPQVPSEETATVHGIVMNRATGEPLPRALVHVTSGKIVGALTDGEGRFSIPGVPTGPQTFDVEKPGFGGVVAMTDYTLPTSHTVQVAAEMPDLHFSLSPQNVIYGQVTLSTGDPAVAINLTLFKQIVQAGHASWNEMDHRQTSPDGQFRFPGLDDGAYLVMAKPSFENDTPEASTCDPKSPAAVSGYPAMFYGGSSDLSGAARITVSGGQSTRANLTLALAEFHAVQATFAQPPGSIPWQIVGGLADSSGMPLEYPLRRDEKAHAFCAYLPDGSYILTVDASTGCGPGTSLLCVARGPDRTRDLQGMLAFSVEGRPLGQLRVPLSNGASTPIHVHYQPAPPAPSVSGISSGDFSDNDPLTVAAYSLNATGGQGENLEAAQSTGNDTYQLGMLKPGRYWIGATANRAGTCLGPVTSGGQSLAHTPWTAGPSGTGQEIDVVVRTDCAKLSLQLPPGLAAEAPGEIPTLSYYVVPAFDFSGDLHEGQLQASSDREVKLDDMTPGTYRVFTFTAPRAIEFQNPEAMNEITGQGQEVTLEPGGSATVVIEVPAS